MQVIGRGLWGTGAAHDLDRKLQLACMSSSRCDGGQRCGRTGRLSVDDFSQSHPRVCTRAPSKLKRGVSSILASVFMALAVSARA